jgi:hypothetical protein
MLFMTLVYALQGQTTSIYDVIGHRTILSLHVYWVVFFYVVFLCIVYGDNSIGFVNPWSYLVMTFKGGHFMVDSNETLQMFKYTCTFVQMHVFSTSGFTNSNSTSNSNSFARDTGL